MNHISVRLPNGSSTINDLQRVRRSKWMIQHHNHDQPTAQDWFEKEKEIASGTYGSIHNIQYKIDTGIMKGIHNTDFILKKVVIKYQLNKALNELNELDKDAKGILDTYTIGNKKFLINVPNDVWVAQKLENIPYQGFMDVHVDPNFTIKNTTRRVSVPLNQSEDKRKLIVSLASLQQFQNGIFQIEYTIYMDNGKTNLTEFFQDPNNLNTYQSPYPILCEVAKQLMIAYKCYNLVHIDLKCLNVMCHIIQVNNRDKLKVQVCDFGGFELFNDKIYGDTFKLPYRVDGNNVLSTRKRTSSNSRAISLYGAWGLYCLLKELTNPNFMMQHFYFANVEQMNLQQFENSKDLLGNDEIFGPIFKSYARTHNHNTLIEVFMENCLIHYTQWDRRLWDAAKREANNIAPPPLPNAIAPIQPQQQAQPQPLALTPIQPQQQASPQLSNTIAPIQPQQQAQPQPLALTPIQPQQQASPQLSNAIAPIQPQQQAPMQSEQPRSSNSPSPSKSMLYPTWSPSPYFLSPDRIDEQSQSPLRSTSQPSNILRETPSPLRNTPDIVQETPSPMRMTPSPLRNSPDIVQETPSPMRMTPSPLRNTPYIVQETPSPLRNSPYIVQETPSPLRNSPDIVQETPMRLMPGYSNIVQQTPSDVVQETPLHLMQDTQSRRATPSQMRVQPSIVQPTYSVVPLSPSSPINNWYSKSPVHKKVRVISPQQKNMVQHVINNHEEEELRMQRVEPEVIIIEDDDNEVPNPAQIKDGIVDVDEGEIRSEHVVPRPIFRGLDATKKNLRNFFDELEGD